MINNKRKGSDDSSTANLEWLEQKLGLGII